MRPGAPASAPPASGGTVQLVQVRRLEHLLAALGSGEGVDREFALDHNLGAVAARRQRDVFVPMAGARGQP